MEDLAAPMPLLRQRSINLGQEQKALAAGLDPLIARILAARPWPEDKSVLDLLAPRLSLLDHPSTMIDLDKAATRIVHAILQQENIGLETDHDCDGQTSHAVLVEALTKHFGHPRDKVYSYIGHRLTEGYGLSLSVAKRILSTQPPPTLVITADNGSSDEERIKLLKAANIDVIVTDHHEIPREGIPKSAFAVLNPTRHDCGYQDKYIAGCMVAWLLMTVVRSKLIEIRHLPEDTPTLAALLDFVAVGTVADCVSFARSYNNRIVVSHGLKLIAKAQRPCFAVMQKWFFKGVTAEDLGFKIGPLLNSDGRLDSALQAVSFLLAENELEAAKWVTYLEEQNLKRKAIQKNITEQSLVLAKKQIAAGKFSICVFLAEGHSGVHGISASRIKDTFGAPVVIFSPKINSDGVITGSVRGIDKLHIRDALQHVADKNPNLLLSFGGHKGAAGVSIFLDDLAKFADEFEIAVRLQVEQKDIGPVIFTDGELPSENFSLDFIAKLNQSLEPFGREFEAPVFQAIAYIVQIKAIGQDETHARVDLSIDSMHASAVWFGIRKNATDPFPITVGAKAQIAYTVKVDYYKGNARLHLQIVHGCIIE